MDTQLTHRTTAGLAITLAAGGLVALSGCSTGQRPSTASAGDGASASSFNGTDTTGRPFSNSAHRGASRGSTQGGRGFDPYGASVTGDGSWPFEGAAPSNGQLSLTPKTEPQYQPSNASTDFYGKLLAESGPGYDAIDPSRSGGGSLQQLSFSLEGTDFDPCVSPDGQWIVYSSTQHGLSSDIYLKSTTSRVTQQLTNDPANDVMPVFSPDGRRVAFASNRAGNWDIYVMDARGGMAVQVTTESAHDLHPSFSPDGRQLVFSRLGEVSGKWEIWVTDSTNNGVAHFLTYGLFPEWNPVQGTGTNGFDQILFQRSRQRGDRAFGVWTIDFRNGIASNPMEVAQSAYHACINPTWSRDGRWIAFATVPNPSQWASESDTRPGNANLWLVSADGGSLVPLTNGQSVNLMPTFGLNNELFFVSDRGGIDNIWKLNVEEPIRVATANTTASSFRTTTASPSTFTPAFPSRFTPSNNGTGIDADMNAAGDARARTFGSTLELPASRQGMNGVTLELNDDGSIRRVVNVPDNDGN